MTSLLSVTVDAGVLAVPSVDRGEEESFQYIETLLDWKKLLDEPWVAIYMSGWASETLFADELYPLRDQLRELFHAHGIVEYDVNTVARIADHLLKITPTFETYYKINDFLSDYLEIEPDVIRLTTHDGLQSDLARCVTLIAVLRKHCAQPLGGHLLILRDAPQKKLQVRAQIHEIEHDRNDIPAIHHPPEIFEGDVLICDDFRGLIECLDEATILVGATDNTGIELAFRIALFKHACEQNEAVEWDDVIPPAIGSEFRQCCQQVCADNEDSLRPKILRAVIETVKAENMPAVHALRIGPGGNNSQRYRGADKAQRRDIDREFHLHYWECSDGTIELASVVYHNDFSIPE